MGTPGRTNAVLITLAVVFLGLTMAFLQNPWGQLPPRPEIPLVDTNFLDTAPVRRSYADLLRAGEDVSDFDCYTCHEKGKPPPIRYYKGALTLPSLVALYRLAYFCVVSSLHDGMNLVAKEFVAARDDEDGVLVLSALAGAAQELRDAIIINPYDIDDFAAALVRAIDMGREERRARMQAMRRVVAGRDVFSWASDILEGLESLWTKPLQYAARAPEDAPV